jgi:hypothetical protein
MKALKSGQTGVGGGFDLGFGRGCSCGGGKQMRKALS